MPDILSELVLPFEFVLESEIDFAICDVLSVPSSSCVFHDDDSMVVTLIMDPKLISMFG